MLTIPASLAPAATHPAEAARLAALRAYNVLDTPKEAAFDDIARLAAQICDAPLATVTLVDGDRQWYKAEIGIGFRETPRALSFCAHAIHEPTLLELEDMRLLTPFADHPAVAGEPGLRFYAGAVLRTPEGLPLGTVCVMDVRPRRLTPPQREALMALARQTMAQLELRRALVETQRANRLRARLMAVAGHDLKQPLQVLAGVLDRFGRRELDARDREWLRLAQGQARRMGEELDELALASGIDGAVAPRLETVRLADALAPSLDGWRAAAERKGLRFRAALGSAEVLSDPRMLTTVTANLVANAVKYTDAGGVLLGARRRGDRVWLQVVDTGVGVPSDRHDVIFEAFHQLDSDREGLGLGLSIVRQTADLLGARMRVSSVPGQGSCFSLDLPRAGRPADGSAQVGEPPP